MNQQEILPEIFCMFHTKLGNEYELPNQQYKINSNSTPDQLNMIVKKLLNVNKKNHNKDFDFLLNQELLVGDIQSYMLKQQLTGEKTLHLEYIFKIGEPKTDKQIQTNDWIQQIYIPFEDSQNYMVCQGNGEVLFFDQNLNKINNVNPLENQSDYVQNIVSQAIIENQDNFNLFQSSFFGELFLSQINKKNFETKQKFLMDNNTSFCCIETDLLQNNIFLGDEEGKLIISQYNENQNNLETKRVSEIHQLPINQILSISEFELITCSQDESLKVLDLMTLKSNFDIYFKESQISCLDFSYQERLIFTGHAQGMIRAFDERTRSKSSAFSFGSYHSYISQVKVNQENPVQFISSDYNGLIRTWDKRMTKALYEINSHDNNKIFCLKWKTKNEFLSGGENKKLCRHLIQLVLS